MEELSKITRLRWTDIKNYCYVVERCISCSKPLTVSVYLKCPDCFIDELIHELIHVLLAQEANYMRLEKAFMYLSRRYKKETKTTQIHIILHAIHSHIYLKFYNKERLTRNIIAMNQVPEYQRSWEIVQKEGHQNIIREFAKRIKKR